MTADASTPPPPTPYWLKQLRRSSLVVLVAAVSLGTLVALHDLRLSSAILVFFCIAGVAMVPLQSRDGVRAREASGGERLTAAAAVRAVFVANASHELRTPLAALSGCIDTLQGPAREDPKARERFLGIMHAQATRMARLIDDLLSLSRVELNAHVRPEARVDLLAILRQVIDGLEVLANDRGVAIETQIPQEAVFIAGDTEELLRVFENLIENGLKYGASGGRVTVSLTRPSPEEGVGEVRVAIRDYGPGIAPEHLPRLTERFYRTDVGDSRAQGGTGLGLSLVKHIVSRHGGRLLIESVFGKGATFTVCFPPFASRSGA